MAPCHGFSQSRSSSLTINSTLRKQSRNAGAQRLKPAVYQALISVQQFDLESASPGVQPCQQKRPGQQVAAQNKLQRHALLAQHSSLPNLAWHKQPWSSTHSAEVVQQCSRDIISSSRCATPTFMQRLHCYVCPCNNAVDKQALPAGAAAMRGVYTSSGAAGPRNTTDEQPGYNGNSHADASEGSRSRRRGTTESRAVLRRTTESRPAIEDVSVMNKSQLMRRNKPWLKEQCNYKGLSYDGLKEDLVQRLLDWQGTDAGKAAAIAARETIAAASKAVEEVQAAAAAAAEQRIVAATEQLLQADAPTAAAGAAAVATTSAEAVAATLPDFTSSCAGMDSRRRRRSTSSAALSNTSSSNNSGTDYMQLGAQSNVLQAQPQQQQQQHQKQKHLPPKSATAAAVDTLTALLKQLQEQPGNAALVAVARNSLELYARGFHATMGTCANASTSCSMRQVVADLRALILSSSSPQSIAALATACYSREVQSPVLAAAMSAAVAAVAKQLGPQEVYRVLRLLAEHLGDAGVEGVGRTLETGFRVLAEGFIGCSEALEPMQLAEAVDLLWKHKYNDPYGLWMISKEAAARLPELAPCDVVVLLDAIAGMCVADNALCRDVAAAVATNRQAYTAQQLQSVGAALRRMGYIEDV